MFIMVFKRYSFLGGYIRFNCKFFYKLFHLLLLYIDTHISSVIVHLIFYVCDHIWTQDIPETKATYLYAQAIIRNKHTQSCNYTILHSYNTIN